MSQSDNTTPHPSSVYDTGVRATIPYYEAFSRESINLVKALGVAPACWLDTGCGTGTLVQQAWPLFPRTEFLLADPSAGMLQEAGRKLAGLPRVRILDPAPTQELILDAPMAVDVVTAIQCHHYLAPEARARATATCFNLLAAGGVYITFENIRPASERGVVIGKVNWMNFQIAQGKTPEAAAEHLRRFRTEYFPITVSEHLALLRESDFSVVELFWYSYMQAGFYAIK